MICLFLQIIEDTVYFILAFLVDINKILLSCMFVKLTEALSVDLSGLALPLPLFLYQTLFSGFLAWPFLQL